MQDEQLKWCLKQKKGIKLVEPSDNLVTAFLGKSASALKSMEANADAGIEDWTISASYYAKYFAVYALLAKLGVKSEIHDCTIAAFKYLFVDEGIADLGLFEELSDSKKERIDAQYYSRVAGIDVNKVMAGTNKFVTKIEEIIDGLDSDKVHSLAGKMKQLVEGEDDG
jgi:uncharacterized protein (UPF0332 family)